MHDNSCSCEAFILNWTQIKAERPRLHVDLGNPSQCKVSIPGQMRHVRLGLAKPEVTKVFNPTCPSYKSIQAFILSLQTDNIADVSEHASSFHRSYSHRQLCYRNLANLKSLTKSLELFVIPIRLLNSIRCARGSLLRRGLKQRLRDYLGYEVGKKLGRILLVSFNDVINNLSLKRVIFKNLSVGRVHHFKCSPKILSR